MGIAAYLTGFASVRLGRANVLQCDGQKRPRGFHSRLKCVGKKTNALCPNAVLINIKKLANRGKENVCLKLLYLSSCSTFIFVYRDFLHAQSRKSRNEVYCCWRPEMICPLARVRMIFCLPVSYCSVRPRKRIIVRGRIAYNVWRPCAGRIS